MKKQIRLYLTITPEEERSISEGYALYLLDNDEQLNRNQWIKKIIMQGVKKK